jgi:hypothetical protein
MRDGPARLAIQVGSGPDADPEELATAAGQLREGLLELDIDNVELERTEAPPVGSKAVDLVEIGSLIVTAAQSQLGQVVAVIGSWLASRPERTVRLEIDGDVLELRGVSSSEQQRLTNAWLARVRQ